ncbi:beta-N-acetylhexosaminidase [Gellertiella hungarica]|uniref:beta-N-acetylhexosaminidase n=1 Tax=Gellertiella hungarica TaxID=1572859 RepID=A0A7W6NL57_9HYPH|nr:beta-N-acetylhexosaminidase [Gellertiella hungarica]MBB4064987.1 beta-N-acetylhexosaminidase [Gellertiella hungarica]
MSESKALILGCSGLTLTADEKAFYRDHRPWGFILFGRNIGDAGQISDLIASMRDCVGWEAPVLIDQEGGRVQRIKPPILQAYPSAQVLGDIYRQDRERGLRAAWLMSRLHAFDLRKLGFTMDCLPVLDVPVEGASNVIGNRAYGFDPVTVTEMGRAAAEGLKAGGMLPCMKHMPGHGRGMADSHHELPVVNASRAELEAHDFAPFRALKDEACGMSCHVVFSAYDAENPATTSRTVIEEVIRGHIGFDGLLISDDSSMNALKGNLAERARAIAASGIDIVLHCNGLMEEMKAVVAEARPLAGKSAERAANALASLKAPDGSSEEMLRAEFNAMLPVA